MKFNVNNNSKKLIISFNVDKKPTTISRIKLLLATGLIVLLTFILGIEILVLTIFLIIPILASLQVTELHFNKEDKTINTVYSFFGKALKTRKEVKDYSICTYSIAYEIIYSNEEHHAVYALRATEYYYHYDLFHFEKFKDAEQIGKCLRENLEITWDDTPPDTSLSRILRSL